jgi:superfamily I DNA/RNA helicase
MLSDVALLTDGVLPGGHDAITHRGGPLLIVGAAGSGKTSLLEARFCWLVEQGARPERIAVLTPSAARADAFRARLEGRLEHGYDELFVLTVVDLASVILRRAAGGAAGDPVVVSAGDRLAMLIDRIDELPLQHHDFGGSANALLGGFVRRIDRLKAELIAAEDYARWAASLASEASSETALELEFAEIYRAHERMLAEGGARDEGDLVCDALRLVREQPAVGGSFEHVLIDDVQELDLAVASLALALSAGRGLTVAGDPAQALRRFRGAGAATIDLFETPDARVVRLERSYRCPERVLQAASAVLPASALASASALE